MRLVELINQRKYALINELNKVYFELIKRVLSYYFGCYPSSHETKKNYDKHHNNDGHIIATCKNFEML